MGKYSYFFEINVTQISLRSILVDFSPLTLPSFYQKFNLQASDLAPLDPRNFWLIFQQKRFEKSDLDHKVGLGDFTLQKSRKLLALDLTLLLYRWQCQHFFW